MRPICQRQAAFLGALPIRERSSRSSRRRLAFDATIPASVQVAGDKAEAAEIASQKGSITRQIQAGDIDPAQERC